MLSGCQSSEKTTYAYLRAYTKAGGNVHTNVLHLSVSTDGVNYQELNKGKGIVYPLAGSKMMKHPNIFRKPDGTFGLIALDNDVTDKVILFDSPHLISYENERNLPLASISEELQACLLSQNIAEPSVLQITKGEYDRLIRKYGATYNTGISGLDDIIISKGEQLNLPEKINVAYSDGSQKQMAVIWNKDDLANVDANTPGKYYIKGEIQQPQYPNPFILQRADPHILLAEDGYYYFTATYPMTYYEDPEGYDRICLRKSKTLEGLREAPEITIWNEKNSDKNHRYIWAPEIHQINGTWYILFTSSRDAYNPWFIRPVLIACNKGNRDPMNPDCWEKTGHYFEALPDDKIAFHHFSLDITYFENKGRHYIAWAEKPGTSNIMIATINPDRPWKLTSQSVLLSVPEYAWEWKNDIWVDEGPAVIKNGNRLYMTFSASSVDEAYCVGILDADMDSDLLDSRSWRKSRFPLLATSDLMDENGPGHNSFTYDAYGNPVIVYHSRTPEEFIDGSLYDPGRHTRIKNINFAWDGYPILNMTAKEELDSCFRQVSVEVIVNE